MKRKQIQSIEVSRSTPDYHFFDNSFVLFDSGDAPDASRVDISRRGVDGKVTSRQYHPSRHWVTRLLFGFASGAFTIGNVLPLLRSNRAPSPEYLSDLLDDEDEYDDETGRDFGCVHWTEKGE